MKSARLLSKLIHPSLAVFAAGLITAGCLPTEEAKEATKDISAPTMTLDLPVSLSGVVTADESTTQNTKSIPNISAVYRNSDTNSDPNACEEHFDPEANFLEDGYNMTRFLVGLSQQQSCFADFIMGSVVAQAGPWMNEGVITLPINEEDPGSPSHVKVSSSNDTVEVWLYFTDAETDLPTDTSLLEKLYLTWTGTGDNIQGQFFMVNLPLNQNDPDAPSGVRLDFTRTATSAENKIYLKLRDTHSGGMQGFRVDVRKDGVGEDATYYASSLIAFSDQPFPNFPAGLDNPNFAASAVVDATGLGASIATFQNFGITLEGDNDQNGVIDTAQNEFDLGAYQFDINDKIYFDPSLNDSALTTPYIEQISEWRNKSVSNSSYVADHVRAIPSPDSQFSILNCLEGDVLCDYNGNGVLDEDSGELLGWNLGVGYFTNTCGDDALVTSNCDTFINHLFSDNTFGSLTLNSTGTEPADWRRNALSDLTQLTSVHPDDDPNGTNTFDVPN